MIKNISKRFLALALVFLMVLSLLPVTAMPAHAAGGGTVSGLSNSDIGLTYTATDDGGYVSWSANGNTITGRVIGKSDGCYSTHYDTTLTIQNNKAVPATLSFDYAIALNSGEIKVNDVAVTENGSFSANVEAGASVAIYLKSGSTDAATSISINNLILRADCDATTTFQPAEHGSYTVDGEPITAAIAEIKNSTESYTLAATPAAGYKFAGWYSVTGDKYISSDISTDLNFDSSQTITAKFVPETSPIFDVASTKKFTDLNEANTYASANNQSMITLVSDGTLPAGEYIISKGVTLLIPFDAAGTCYTTAPATVGDSYTTPSPFRTLTMAEGASITVDGAISVSAKHTARGNGGETIPGGGAPSGDYGYISMEGGSSITIHDGGALYAWGYVSGDGTVTAESGAAVYENFQIRDFRGGTASKGLAENAKGKAFLFNQYYIQNIEAKLILEYGASEYVYTSLYAASMSNSTSIKFIGEGGMFSVAEGGSFIKQYLPAEDRLEVTVSGDATIQSLSLKLRVLVTTLDVNSKEYVLPISNCMTLKVLSGTTTITQDIALLPGVVVDVAQGATLTNDEGTNIYVYDRDEWIGRNFATGNLKPVIYSPTRTYTRTANDLVDAKVDVNGDVVLNGYAYTTDSGADICSSRGTGSITFVNGAGDKTEAYQAVGTASDVTPIPITSAKLRNGDGSYTETANAEAGDVFLYAEDAWRAAITVTFDPNGGKGSAVQAVTGGVDTTLITNTFARENYIFNGWNTQPDGSGTSYADGATVNFTEDTTLYAQWLRNGWFSDENGTAYYEQGEQYKDRWASMEDKTYYFNEDGYIVTGIYEVIPQGGTEKARCVFDADGVFQSEVTGVYDVGADTYWLNAGIIEEYPGLKRIVNEDGHIHYYYFGKDGQAVKNGDYKVEKNNGLPLPCYQYPFDGTGVIVHDEDTSKNGICAGDASKFYYIDGVKVGEGLLCVDGSYYYAQTSSGKIVQNMSYWISKINGYPIQEGTYWFDADGKLITDGFVTENDTTYYFQDTKLVKGFTKIGEDYYFFNTGNGRMYQETTLWVGANPYGICDGWYAFGVDGKLMKTGFVTGRDAIYYYQDTERVKGFTKIGDDYYFFNASSGKLYQDADLWVPANSYGIEVGMHYFDKDGKLFIPDLENGPKEIINEDGKLYFTLDGVKLRNGLYELDGEYYYAQAGGELAVSKSIYVTTNLLDGTGWYGFDADGKLIQNGFINDTDGCTYYYSNGVRAKGFTKIGDDYYFFNIGSGKLYKNDKLWVGVNDYGIAAGMYVFDSNGQMRVNGEG